MACKNVEDYSKRCVYQENKKADTWFSNICSYTIGYGICPFLTPKDMVQLQCCTSRLLNIVVPILAKDVIWNWSEVRLWTGFPKYIKRLNVNSGFSNDDFQRLTDQLTEMYINVRINELEKGLLPDSLCHLSLMKYIHPLNPGVLPPNLTSLRFGHNFNHTIYHDVLLQV